MKIARLFPVFGATFAVLYVISITYNLALFSYHPQLNRWAFLVVPAQGGVTPMYWYGWLATSAIGATIAAIVANFVPDNWSSRVWSGWTWMLPLGAMLYITYVLREYFFR